MTQELKSPDVSYVTEQQRRWIEKYAGTDWDRLREVVISSNPLSLDDYDRVTPCMLREVVNEFISSVPEDYRHVSTLTMLSCGEGACYLYWKYNRLENEREFNQRIAAYLHRWEELKAMYEKQRDVFE